MRKIGCSDCIFATVSPPMSGGPFGVFQTGCKAGRLGEYIDRDLAELRPSSVIESEEANQFYNLKTLCNMSRNYEWVKINKLQEATSEELLDTAREQISLGFGVVVEIDGESEQQLAGTINSIKKIEYDHKNITVVISALKKDFHSQIYLNFVEELRSLGISTWLVLHKMSEQSVIDTDSMTHIFDAGRSYICKVRAGSIIDSDIMKYIDEAINDDLQKIVVFEDKENDSVFVNSQAINMLYLDYLNNILTVKEIRKQSIDQKNYREYEKKK